MSVICGSRCDRKIPFAVSVDNRQVQNMVHGRYGIEINEIGAVEAHKPTKNRFADQETQVGMAGPYTAKII